MNDIARAYDAQTHAVGRMLGSAISPQDPDRLIIEPWAATVSGPILDVGSGTGRWTGHLAALGHEVAGLEPAKRLLRIARETYPSVPFSHGTIADLHKTDRRWAGILAWYSIIHMDPQELSDALATFRTALEPDGTLLMSFFAGPRLEAFAHPVATAYRWPMTAMVEVLHKTGFRVTTQHWRPSAPHAYVIATSDRSAEIGRGT